MRLMISRSQAEQTDRKGRSEGVLFQFGCRLVLEQSEREIVEKYRLSSYPLAFLPMTEIRDLSQDDMQMTPDRLINQGWSFQTRFASDAHHAEEIIKQGCSDFKGVMKMLVSYGGDEEITID